MIANPNALILSLLERLMSYHRILCDFTNDNEDDGGICFELFQFRQRK